MRFPGISSHAARRRAATMLTVVALGAGMLALGACKHGDEGDAQAKDAAAKGPEAVPVEVAAVSRRPIAASYSGTAPLEARGESQVIAKTSGVALRVMAEEGQQVRAGQVLVQLDSARAALQAAQSGSQMRKLEANYARSRQLAEQKLISANDIDTIKFDLENARVTGDPVVEEKLISEFLDRQGDAGAVGADRDRSDAEDDVDAEPHRKKSEHARVS